MVSHHQVAETKNLVILQNITNGWGKKSTNYKEHECADF